MLKDDQWLVRNIYRSYTTSTKGLLLLLLLLGLVIMPWGAIIIQD